MSTARSTDVIDIVVDVLTRSICDGCPIDVVPGWTLTSSGSGTASSTPHGTSTRVVSRTSSARTGVGPAPPNKTQSLGVGYASNGSKVSNSLPHGTLTRAEREAATANALVAAAKAGDQQAFDALVKRYRKRIFALALHICGSSSEADDITQDVFLKAFRALPQFEGRSEFFTWVYRMTVNRSLNARRDGAGEAAAQARAVGRAVACARRARVLDPGALQGPRVVHAPSAVS